MSRFSEAEVFKEIELEWKMQLRYAISNFGNIMSFKESFEDGRVLKSGLVQGYRSLSLKKRIDDKLHYKSLYLFRLVATYFLEKEHEDQVYVIHLDNNKTNDFYGNLKWATKEEMLKHQHANPLVLAGRERLIEFNKKRDGHKLTSTKVIFIKKRLADPNNKTRMKMLAKQFGISEMQLYRIKSGENWGHIKI